MTPVNIMVNGLPGNVAATVAKKVLADTRFELVPHSLTGPEIAEREITVAGASIELIQPDGRTEKLEAIRVDHGPFISVDFTHPSAVNLNAEFYCRNHLPFVMGTTGGDRTRLAEVVAESDVCAVIAPNMAKQIVGFQAMMAYAAETFPGLFNGYSLDIRESHQAGKADTSGTAKAMVGYFNRLGVPFAEADIAKERDPDIQREQWGIPEEFIGGHGWHTYSLVSRDRTVRFQFTHNVNGREIYGRGTLDAVLFLNEKIGHGERGRVFSMIDVLQGS